MSVVTKESNPELYNALFPEDEIKEILDYLKDDKWDYYPSDGIPYKVLLMEERDKLLDYITNLEECCKDKIDRYQDMILKYCELDGKYKKSCETYQKTIDETMSEKMDLEKENKRLKELDENYPIEEQLEEALKYENIYKSRNEKAIELLKEAGCYDEETKTFCDDIWEELPELYEILTGGDE